MLSLISAHPGTLELLHRAAAACASSVAPGKALGAGALAPSGLGASLASAKAQRIQDDIAEIVRRVFAVDGMSIVVTSVYIDVL